MSEEMKKLGFGLMRLPQREGADPNSETENPFDIDTVKKMVDMFMDAGFTYFDTAWAYNWSEGTIRQALVERYPRESFKLATKCAAWIECKTRDDAIAQFDASMKYTQAGYFDYYLLHNLGTPRTEMFDNFGLWDYFLGKKKEGLIRNFGFSFHGMPQELEELLSAHGEDVDFVQMQLNYADWEDARMRSRENYEIARKYGKPVVVMEPVKGGLLADPPESVKAIFDEADPDASYASWAIRFAASLEGVMVVLSGMSNVEQMQNNISYMEDFKPLTTDEQAVIRRAQDALASTPIIPCTCCEYCAKVCPQNIGIPGTFMALNQLIMYGDKKSAKGREQWNVPMHGKARAIDCIECGACEDACPQHIAIRDELKRAVQEFEMESDN